MVGSVYVSDAFHGKKLQELNTICYATHGVEMSSMILNIHGKNAGMDNWAFGVIGYCKLSLTLYAVPTRMKRMQNFSRSKDLKTGLICGVSQMRYNAMSTGISCFSRVTFPAFCSVV